MPLFSQIALLATVAFAALSAAAPAAAPKRDLPVALSAILTQLSLDLAPVTAPPLYAASLVLFYHLADMRFQQVITPLTDEIASIISGALAQVGALAGALLDTVLPTADGIIFVTDAAALLAPVLSTIYGALGDVLAVVNGTPAGPLIQPLINDAFDLLNPLLTVIAPLISTPSSCFVRLPGPLTLPAYQRLQTAQPLADEKLSDRLRRAVPHKHELQDPGA
ncbi:hypothetical protein FB451DRAFT_1513345 [Mycena latifolia]|nr:hypothetical protein FB451DRAFT_1513345 [Mycena latifolia]